MNLINTCSLLLIVCYTISETNGFVSNSRIQRQQYPTRKGNSFLASTSHHHHHDDPLLSTITSLDTTFDFPSSSNHDVKETRMSQSLAPIIASSLAFVPLSAGAVSTGTNQVISAFVAYGHYLSLFVMVGALMFERLTIAPGMSKEKEQTLVLADAAYGLSAVALLVSGYYRAVEYGKGWYFYSHEPIFWLKMVFFMILGSASLFPTITSIKRAVSASKGDDSWQPMSEKLANRMKSVINAELVMMGSIPLSATLMSRGVGYSESIPFDVVGPVVTALTAVGLGFKYSKEAITWSEED